MKNVTYNASGLYSCSGDKSNQGNLSQNLILEWQTCGPHGRKKRNEQVAIITSSSLYIFVQGEIFNKCRERKNTIIEMFSIRRCNRSYFRLLFGFVSSLLDSTKIKAHQDRYFYFISVVENHDLFVPCRPLNPDVNVTLTLEGTNVRIGRKTCR